MTSKITAKGERADVVRRDLNGVIYSVGNGTLFFMKNNQWDALTNYTSPKQVQS